MLERNDQSQKKCVFMSLVLSTCETMKNSLHPLGFNFLINKTGTISK